VKVAARHLEAVKVEVHGEHVQGGQALDVARHAGLRPGQAPQKVVRAAQVHVEGDPHTLVRGPHRHAVDTLRAAPERGQRGHLGDGAVVDAELAERAVRRPYDRLLDLARAPVRRAKQQA
jgi:hypothetical protein